jgi:hypothetical protein
MMHPQLAQRVSFQGWEIAMNIMNKELMNTLNKQLQITTVWWSDGVESL